MIAVKAGTTNWRISDTLAADEVEFAGQYLYEANGLTSAMVWDASLNNIRPRNATETLAATKLARIESDRQECRRRLIEHYGDALEQVSRASGLYGETALANHAAGVEACIDASNTARDEINAATTVAAVEAVTVSWPVLT